MHEYPYWWDTAPALCLGPDNPPATPPDIDTGVDRSRFDVVVVGAGYTGLAAGRQLARIGASVLFVEREQALLARVFFHRVHVVPRSDQRGEIGSHAYHGLMLDERSGAINPARYVAGLAAAARRAGALIVTGVAVRALRPGAGGWTIE